MYAYTVYDTLPRATLLLCILEQDVIHIYHINIFIGIKHPPYFIDDLLISFIHFETRCT